MPETTGHAQSVWPAIVLAPVLALGDLLLINALTAPSCPLQNESWLHVVALAFLGLLLLITAIAWGDARRLRRLTRAPMQPKALSRRRYFIALSAALIGVLSTLTVLLLALPRWIHSPCFA